MLYKLNITKICDTFQLYSRIILIHPKYQIDKHSFKLNFDFYNNNNLTL